MDTKIKDQMVQALRLAREALLYSSADARTPEATRRHIDARQAVAHALVAAGETL